MADQAKEYYEQATNLMKWSSLKIFFGQYGCIDDAADLYMRSAHIYLSRKEYENAQNSYNKSFECYLRLKDMHNCIEIALKLANIAKIQNDIPEYESKINYVIEQLVESDQIDKAAKYSQELGDSCQDPEESNKYYQQAIQYYESNNSNNSQLITCLNKLANNKIKSGEYKIAIETLNKIFVKSVDDRLLKWKIDEPIERIIYCHLALNDFDGAQKGDAYYCEQCPTWEHCRAHEFICELLKTFHDGDVDNLVEIIKNYDDIKTMDAVNINLLLKIKVNMIDTPII